MRTAIILLTMFGFTNSYAMDSALPTTKGRFTSVDEQLSQACREGGYLIEAMQGGPQRALMRKMAKAASSLKAGRLFNLSLAELSSGDYLVAARIVYLEHDLMFSTSLVPGNRHESKFEKGSNFWWMDWADKKFAKGTLYFRADKTLSKFELMVPWAVSSYDWYSGIDIRLFSQDGEIYGFRPCGSELVAKITILKHPEASAI